MLKKFMELPTNTKILAGILGIMVVAGLVWAVGAASNSEYAVERRERAQRQQLGDRLLCEGRVKQQFYGRLNTPAFEEALKQCR